MNHINNWILENPTLYNIIKYAMIVAFVLLVIQLLRRFLKKNISNSSARYKSQKGIEFIGYVLLVILSFSYFTGNIKDFTLAIGLFSAGIAFTLQELILSIAGSIYIFVVKVYKPGDRIEINGIKGDVIDVDSIYTTMMEIGQWVSSDNYSGRIVKLSNAFVFKGPIYNYSQDFPFIWDEFNLPIKYGSDIELAKSIVIEIASKSLSDFTANSKAQWKEIVNKYYVEDAQVEPTLAITLTDNWVQFNLRYIVNYKKRRITKHELNDSIRKAIESTNGKVTLASTTIELVKIPEIKVDVTK
ncbi:mechanosensitive ion channel family protein [Xanthomarina gelatinilytica]|uniref:mechanosensitive ion channel family protein n=1 Tax=Xanthomarina gelatinilytica TaxID=1137281 RepID=UPI003AA81E2F